MKALIAWAALAFIIGPAVPQTDPLLLVADDDLVAAEREYRALLAASPDDPRLSYNLGTVLLMRRRFDEAREILGAAAPNAGPLRGDAHYNLGAADLEPAFADSLLPDRTERLRRAVDAYRDALLVDPRDDDARWNLELALRLLKRDSPPPAGGGGGGGGGNGPPTPGRSTMEPRPAAGPGRQPDVAEVEAENLLRRAQERELSVQRERLRKSQPEILRP